MNRSLCALTAGAFLAIAPLAACGFECIAEKNQLRLDGTWREYRGAGSINIICYKIEDTKSPSGPSVSRWCMGTWLAVKSAGRFRSGDLLFAIRDPDPLNQWDGCKLFVGNEYKPGIRGGVPQGSSSFAARIHMSLQWHDVYATGPTVPAVRYEVDGRPQEATWFSLEMPRGWKP